jgi:hypothetical protein
MELAIILIVTGIIMILGGVVLKIISSTNPKAAEKVEDIILTVTFVLFIFTIGKWLINLFNILFGGCKEK